MPSTYVHPHRAQHVKLVHKPALSLGLLSEAGSASVRLDRILVRISLRANKSVSEIHGAPWNPPSLMMYCRTSTSSPCGAFSWTTEGTVRERLNRVSLKDVTFRDAGSRGFPGVTRTKSFSVSSGMVVGLRHHGASIPVATESKDEALPLSPP